MALSTSHKGVIALAAEVLAGLVAVAGVSAVVLRLVDFERPALFPVVAVVPAIVAAAAVVLLIIGPTRSVRVITAATLVLLAFIAPRSLFRFRCDTESTGQSISVYTHNVSYRNGLPDEEADQIGRIDPDIVFLQEADPEFVTAMQNRLFRPYPFAAATRSDQTRGLAILSKWPIEDVIDTGEERLNPLLIATIQTPGGPLRAANVHLTAPRSAPSVGRWRAEYDLVGSFTADMLIGDFNSSHSHRRFRELLATGYTDTHSAVGCGLGTTWSVDGRPPSLLALDHVLVKQGKLEPLGIGKLERAGSDHRAVVATVEIP